MYCISEKQIDFILNDISARGIEMVSLQQDLLDHICCIIEQNLEEDGDFENFYFSCIERFYSKNLKEIEEETIDLLIHKNYYVMKKIMLLSGGLCSLFLSVGIVFKFMHWPGAAALIVFGIVMMSLVFLPLLFVLKVKEKKESKEKIIIGLGSLAAVSLSLGVLFKIMHWPFANMLSLIAMFIMLLLFLPIYYFSGTRNPETKVNTTVSSILIVVGCALVLTLVRSPQATRKILAQNTEVYFRNELILKKEYNISKSNLIMDKSNMELYNSCEKLKAQLLKQEIGATKITADFEIKNILISESAIGDFAAKAEISNLKQKIEKYNLKLAKEQQQILIDNSFIDSKDMPIDAVLNSIIQIQMIVLQNQRS